MASKATRQSIALLAIIGGSLTRIDECRMFSVVAMKKLVKDTYKQTINILNTWPDGAYNVDDANWIDERVVQWGIFLKDVKEHHTLAVFATMCSICLDDLESVIRNKQKLSMIQTLREPVNAILKFIDPNLENFPAFDKADTAMAYFYKLVEWDK